MKLSRISFLFLLLFLFVPSFSYAQSAASKSWQPFWTKFSSAVKNKNKTVIRSLMASESEFSNGGGAETRFEWLNQMMKSKSAWREMQNSIAGGTVAYNESGRTGRITKDRVFIFQYFGGKWQFVGVMGD